MRMRDNMSPSRGWLAYGDLAEGEQFRFVYGLTGDRTSVQVFTKGRNGWFSDGERRRYRTGAGTAVERVRQTVVRVLGDYSPLPSPRMKP